MFKMTMITIAASFIGRTKSAGLTAAQHSVAEAAPQHVKDMDGLLAPPQPSAGAVLQEAAQIHKLWEKKDGCPWATAQKSAGISPGAQSTAPQPKPGADSGAEAQVPPSAGTLPEAAPNSNHSIAAPTEEVVQPSLQSPSASFRLRTDLSAASAQAQAGSSSRAQSITSQPQAGISLENHQVNHNQHHQNMSAEERSKSNWADRWKTCPWAAREKLRPSTGTSPGTPPSPSQTKPSEDSVAKEPSQWQMVGHQDRTSKHYDVIWDILRQRTSGTARRRLLTTSNEQVNEQSARFIRAQASGRRRLQATSGESEAAKADNSAAHSMKKPGWRYLL